MEGAKYEDFVVLRRRGAYVGTWMRSDIAAELVKWISPAAVNEFRLAVYKAIHKDEARDECAKKQGPSAVELAEDVMIAKALEILRNRIEKAEAPKKNNNKND